MFVCVCACAHKCMCVCVCACNNYVNIRTCKAAELEILSKSNDVSYYRLIYETGHNSRMHMNEDDSPIAVTEWTPSHDAMVARRGEGGREGGERKGEREGGSEGGRGREGGREGVRGREREVEGDKERGIKRRPCKSSAPDSPSMVPVKYSDVIPEVSIRLG